MQQHLCVCSLQQSWELGGVPPISLLNMKNSESSSFVFLLSPSEVKAREESWGGWHLHPRWPRSGAKRKHWRHSELQLLCQMLLITSGKNDVICNQNHCRPYRAIRFGWKLFFLLQLFKWRRKKILIFSEHLLCAMHSLRTVICISYWYFFY